MNDRVRWMTANGYKWGTVVKENRRYALVQMDNGKQMLLNKEYIKKHNKSEQ